MLYEYKILPKTGDCPLSHADESRANVRLRAMKINKEKKWGKKNHIKFKAQNTQMSISPP